MEQREGKEYGEVRLDLGNEEKEQLRLNNKLVVKAEVREEPTITLRLLTFWIFFL